LDVKGSKKFKVSISGVLVTWLMKTHRYLFLLVTRRSGRGFPNRYLTPGGHLCVRWKKTRNIKPVQVPPL